MSRTAKINAVLGAILLALCVWLVLFAVRGDAAAPGTTPAEAKTQQYAAIQKAAHEETLAFLEIDHTRMDELTARVLDGATGDFKEQYAASVESLIQSAASQESFSEGTIEEIGLSEVDDDSAAVFVAAGSEVKNKDTDGKLEDRFWRIKLSMVKEGDRWLVSQLEFVG